MAAEPRQLIAEFSTAPQPSYDVLRNRRVRMGSVEPPLLGLARHALYPLVAVLILLGCTWGLTNEVKPSDGALSILLFLTAGQLLTSPPFRPDLKTLRLIGLLLPRLLGEWLLTLAVLFIVLTTLEISAGFSPRVLLLSAVLFPVAAIVAAMVKSKLRRMLAQSQDAEARHIIIGANHVGVELNRRATRVCHSEFLGYFDDRSVDRLPPETHAELRGDMTDVVEFVHAQNVTAIYITLPLSAAPRMTALVNALRNTAASVYVVPDIFSFDVIQARFAEIDGIPVVSLHDTPFSGQHALLKRASDVIMASVILALIWPLMLGIALGVKLTSRGPALFKQRRYGLNGEEILVYKFRSMCVQENGSKVVQATRFDQRVTKFGAFLRRTSLDELPQILNVLQGRMSLVGPRPHAVAHNEQYRKLISGYMFRHMVRPGITGWAQVNGLRGETETIDKMRQRVEYDIDYLRHWSPWLDIKILLRTLKLLGNDSQAY